MIKQRCLHIPGVGRGFDIRQRTPSEGSFPGKPGGEYWRTNSREPREPQTPTSVVTEEEAWSLTAGNKPWTGKKGSAGLVTNSVNFSYFFYFRILILNAFYY